MFRKILFPTDFSDVSQKAFEYVKKLMEAGTEDVIILHVIHEDDIEAMVEGCLMRDESLEQCRNETEERMKEKAEERMKPMVRDLINLGLNARSTVLIGKPVKVIVDVARDEKVSLIVMGTHGHSLLRDAFVGSVAESVIHYTHVPVLLVR